MSTVERDITVDDFRNPPELADLIGRIDDVSPKLAAELAKILCKHFKYHYGSYSSSGLVEDGKVERCWSCWNCGWEVTQVTKVNNLRGREIA